MGIAMTETIAQSKKQKYKKIQRDSTVNRDKLMVNGVKLTEARIAAGLGTIEVAKLLGCGKSSVSKWEMEYLIPSEERILKLVELYGTAEFLDWNRVAVSRLGELGAKVRELTEGKQ